MEKIPFEEEGQKIGLYGLSSLQEGVFFRRTRQNLLLREMQGEGEKETAG